MSKVGLWSTTAGNNNSTPPDGWPEGQAPSTVNDCARENMAALKTALQDIDFFDHAFSPTFINANSFSVPGDQTARLNANRQLKLFDATTHIRSIGSASFTTVTTVSLGAGTALTSSLTSFAVSIINPTNSALPNNFNRISASAIEATTLSVGNTTISGTLSASGAATLHTTLSVSGAVVLKTTLSVEGATVLGTTLTVGGATALGTTLSVSGAATLKSTLSVEGATVLSTTLSVSGAAVLKSTLSVGGATNIGATLTVSGATSLLTTLTVGGTTVLSGAVSLATTLSVSGATVLKATLSVGGAVTLAGTLSVSGTVVAANVAKAWGNIFCDITATATTSFNITNVDRSALGVYKVNFTTVFSDALYAHVVSTNSFDASPRSVTATTTYVKFSIVNPNGSAVDGVRINLIAYR